MSTEINLINKIVVLDEGTILTSDATSLNFTGPGVTATSINGDVTIDITGGGGGGSVIDVTASTPLFSTGGATPDISIQQASALQDGYLSALDWTNFNSKVSSSLLGANNGVATLDSGGKVPVTQLPNSIMDYKGTYDIITNTPTLVNGTGNAGDVYINTAAGTRDFGAGPITVAIGDWLVYDGSVWQKSVNSNAVASVNGYTGIVVLNKSDIGLSNVENTALSTWAGSSNITTVGTIGSGIWNGTPIGDSYLSSSFVKTNGTTPLTADWNAGSFRITTGNITSNGDALINGLTVGKGSGSISSNTALGLQALRDNTTGTSNTGLGLNALVSNTTGFGNTAVGANAFTTNTTGSLNTAVGSYTLSVANTTNLTAVGSYALNYTTTGFNNTAVGTSALSTNTTGINNTAVGTDALANNTTSGYNAAFGRQTLGANTTGTGNSSFGTMSLWVNTTGNFNSALGLYALQLNTTGSNNTAIGVQSLSKVTLGDNTALGYYSGTYLANGTTHNTNSSNSLFLGASTKSGTAGSSNEIVIGYNVVGKGSNTAIIGLQGTTTDTWLAGYLHVNSAYKLPNADGTNGQILQTDGAGNATWQNSAGGGGTVTSVGLSMPSAFSVASSPITGAGTIAVTGAGISSQYVRGDGTLANFPTSTGGGASVSYYLNGSVSQGTIGGVVYQEMNATPVIGAGTDFSITADGYIAQFITDAGDPNKLLIPGGNWNFETYFSASSGGGTPQFYIELYKYDGAIFTLISSTSASPENITGGTSIDLYFTALAVPPTVLSITDRLAVRFYVIHSGRTITMHTENSHLSQIITTFSTGLNALNGLTSQAQYFATGTSGIDFNISSATDTHTFNLPTASATNRGLLSTADWITFNSKGNGTVTSVAALTLGTTGTDVSSSVATGSTTPVITLNIPTASATNRGALSFTDWSTFNSKQDTLSLTTTGSSGSASLVGSTLNVPTYTLAGLGGITLSSLSANTPLSYNTGTGAFSIQVATTAQNGYLSFADWNTFSGKVGGSGTADYVSKFTASGTIGNSLIQDNGTNLGISTAPVAGTKVTIQGSTGHGLRANTTGDGKYGLYGSNVNDGPGTFVGVYGEALDNGGRFVNTTWVGGKFFATNGVDQDGVYSLWLQDGTESIGRFLKSITADGKANWATMSVADTGLTLTTTGSSGASTLVGNTLNIPQYTGGTGSFDYGLSYAMASQNILL